VHGERKTLEGYWLTQVSLEPLGMAVWCDSPVADAEQKRQSLITRITTNLLKSSGFASPATSSGTKN
jgi:hypothetical protein